MHIGTNETLSEVWLLGCLWFGVASALVVFVGLYRVVDVSGIFE